MTKQKCLPHWMISAVQYLDHINEFNNLADLVWRGAGVDGITPQERNQLAKLVLQTGKWTRTPYKGTTKGYRWLKIKGHWEGPVWIAASSNGPIWVDDDGRLHIRKKAARVRL